MTLEEALGQKVFKHPTQKGMINIMHSASCVYNQQNKLLKEFDLTVQQFNILRILRGRHPQACTLKYITGRMIDRNSNTSRLVDKLIAKDLVARSNSCEDRRRVDIGVTIKGLSLVEKASSRLEQSVLTSSTLTEEEATELNRLLDKVRSDFQVD